MVDDQKVPANNFQTHPAQMTEAATNKELEDVQKKHPELDRRIKMVLDAAVGHANINNKIATNPEKTDDLAALRKEFNIYRKVNEKKVETTSENVNKLD